MSDHQPELAYHPLATIFPMMEGADFEALVLDIIENGVQEPIIIHEGMILDDRRKDHLVSIALGIKAANAVHEGRKVRLLTWKSQGQITEEFPKLNVGSVTKVAVAA